MNNHKLTYEDYKRYLSNAMTERERHAFEKLMMQDAFDEEAFDGLQQIGGDTALAQMERLKEQIEIKSRRTKTHIPLWMRYSAAAVMVVGLGISTIMYFNSDPTYDLEYGSLQNSSVAMADTTDMSKPEKVEIQTKETLEEIPVAEAKKERPIEKPKSVQKTVTTVAEQPIEEVESEIVVMMEVEKEDQDMAIIEEAEMEETMAEPNNIQVDAVSGKSAEHMGEMSRTSKKSANERRITADEAAAPATAPRTDTRKAMPPKGLDYASFQNKLNNEIALILANHNENFEQLTITISIDAQGLVSKTKVKENITRKTGKTIETYIKEFGLWQPEIENGVARASEQTILLNFNKK